MAKLGALLRLDLRKIGTPGPTGVRLWHSVRFRPNKALPEREPLVVSYKVCLDSAEGLLRLDAKLDELVVIPLKLCFKGIAARSSFRINCVKLVLKSVASCGSFRLNGIAARRGLRIDGINPGRQLLVESIDSTAQPSRAAEDRSENSEHTGDERHARENSLKAHLDHPSILTRTTDATHLFR